MPTPNIPDEVVEAAAKAAFEWRMDDGGNPARWEHLEDEAKDRLPRQAKVSLESALPLLLEQCGYLDSFGSMWHVESIPKSIGKKTAEPLYRLKVSNEQ